MEEIDDDTLIPSQVILPSLTSDFKVRPSVGILELDVRLHLDSVQILVKAVEEKGEQLLSVVLLETGELRRVFACE